MRIGKMNGKPDAAKATNATNCPTSLARVVALGLMIALVAPESTQAQDGRGFSLYSDRKARRAEDVITVLVVESAKAVNDSRTATDKKLAGDLGISPGTGKLDQIPGMGLSYGGDFSYDGKGKTSRVGEVKATLSARIVAVYDNGNLLIEGHKEVEVNKETEIIRVSGIVRPEDISSDNTIYSFKIADARIHYSGKGDVDQAGRPGWLARFFNWIF